LRKLKSERTNGEPNTRCYVILLTVAVGGMCGDETDEKNDYEVLDTAEHRGERREELLRDMNDPALLILDRCGQSCGSA
jgi:hypothetical protein